MAEFITVTATKQHLADATRAESQRNVVSNCLVARAVKAAVKGRKSVSVFGTTASIEGNIYDVSKKGQALVTRFDNIYSEIDPKAAKKRTTALRASLPVTFRLTRQGTE